VQAGSFTEQARYESKRASREAGLRGKSRRDEENDRGFVNQSRENHFVSSLKELFTPSSKLERDTGFHVSFWPVNLEPA
jgi:hypothetical protein